MTTPAREHSRFDVDLAAEVVQGEQSFTARTRNISEGGCCIESAYPLKESSELSISLFLVVDGVEEPDFPPMNVIATVQWTAENEDADMNALHLAGLKFINMTDAQVSWLRGMVKTT